MNKLFLYSVIILLSLCVFSASTAIAITSDDFNSPTLNETLWNKVDPLNDATFTIIGEGTSDAFLSISIPGGTDHNLWDDGNNASWISQSVADTDFEVEVKFQSQVSKQYQMQGIIIQNDSRNFLRIELHSDGSYTKIFAANFTPNLTTGLLDHKIITSDTINSGSSAVPMYLRLKRMGDQWTLYYSYNGINWIVAANFNDELNVSSVGPFVGNIGPSSGTPSPAFTGLIDYFFNTSSPIVPEDIADTTPPKITLWYGNSQSFGQLGVPQQWVNILGNVSDISGVATLSYSLKGGSDLPLTIGPDGLRLESSGDFNIEINRTDLSCGDNLVVIKAVDGSGNMKSDSITIQYTCDKVWPKIYSINWSDVANIQDVAQILDGQWTKETNSIHTSVTGYDRLVAIGDITWDDYEITVPVTLNSPLDTSKYYGNFVGFGMRWKGHYDWDGKQPRWGWWPLGAIGGYSKVGNDYRLQIQGNNGAVIADDTSGMKLTVGVPYIFKMRAQTNGANTLYSLRVWKQADVEPSTWTISGIGVPGELKQGSVLLMSHNADVIFGNIIIRPGPFVPEDTNPVPGLFNISGYKVNDTNGNGIWNTGEQGIPNWNISLINETTGVEIYTTTDASGFYRFSNLPNGKYNVTEETRSGFIATGSTFLRITLSGQDITNLNFTNQILTTPPSPVAGLYNMSGYKINDTNGNGIWNIGEQGIPNWKISLINETTGVEIYTTTDASGFYRFANLPNGKYNVTEETGSGFIATGSTFFRIILSGQDITNLNFTNQILTTPPSPVAGLYNISGYKINDTNGNGIWNTGEQGIPNWKISLINKTTGVEIYTTTDASGFYRFSNLPNGKYNVTEETRSGFIATGSTFFRIILSGQDITNLNFTNQILTTPPSPVAGLYNISGYKINDTNGNGIWNTGEQGIPNWKISLINKTTGVEIYTTTDASGFYRFSNLPNGKYNVTEETRSGYIATGSTFLRITLSGQDVTNLNFTNKILATPPSPGIISVDVKIKPETINLASKGEFTVYINLPDNYDGGNIQLSTLICQGAQALKIKVTGKGSYIAKFKTQDLNILDIPIGKKVNLKVTGIVISKGRQIGFEGTDTIKVIKQGPKTDEKDKEKDDNKESDDKDKKSDDFIKHEKKTDDKDKKSIDSEKNNNKRT